MDSTAVAPPLDKPMVQSRDDRWKIYATRGLVWLLIGAGCFIRARQGLRLRYWTYQATDPIRFLDDMRRGTFWGLLASGKEGYLNQYEKMDPQVPEWQDSRWTPWLDYSPLRLLVMREWGVWQRANRPPDPNVPLMDAWQRDYEFTAPVLHFNTVLEGLSAIFAFFLTRLWVVRGSEAEKRGHFCGVWQGLVATLLIWFSPDIIMNAHGWPQWDSWVVPWYLGGVLLASLDWWFAAGVMIIIGANFKGQMFPITPIFLIWPLVQGKFGAATRWILGAVFCYGLVTSGWMLSYIPPDRLAAARSIQADLGTTDFPSDLFVIPRRFDIGAAIWIFEMLVAAAAVPWLLQLLMPVQTPVEDSRFKKILHSRWTWYGVAGVCIFGAVYWPWLVPKNRSGWYLGIVAGAGVATAVLALRRRNQPYVWAGIVGGGLLSCMWLFHGSSAWWDCSVHYGSIHWPYLFIGPTSNVPAIFQLRFGWPREVDQIAFTLPAVHAHWPSFIVRQGWWPAFDADLTAKFVFNTIYGVLLLVSGIAIGVQTRRNDRRALVAFVTPWVMFFLFPVQIQERYLLYGAAAAACCIGDSVGAALLGVLLTIFSVMMPLKEQVDIGSSNLDEFGQNLSDAMPRIFSPQFGHTMQQYLDGTQPDIAWGILVVGLIFLYLSLTPSRPRLRAVTVE